MNVLSWLGAKTQARCFLLACVSFAIVWQATSVALAAADASTRRSMETLASEGARTPVVELVAAPSGTPSPSATEPDMHLSRQDDGVSGFQWFLTGFFAIVLLSLFVFGGRASRP